MLKTINYQLCNNIIKNSKLIYQKNNKKYFFSTEFNEKGALKHIRVLDLSRILVGPLCTMQLSDMGAEVIKIEPFGGDETRKWGPPFVEFKDQQDEKQIEQLGQDSSYYLSVNRNKKSICIDLKSQQGQEIIYDLVKKSDVVLENFSNGVAKRLNIDYETLKKINDKIVYLTITGYGQSGPKSNFAAFDLVMQADSGYMSITGPAKGEPSKLGFAITDVLAGLYATNGVLAALYNRQITGNGQYITTSLLECSLASLVNISSQYLNGGKAPQRLGNDHPSIVPYGTYKCGVEKDAQYIVLGAGTDNQFYKFCELVGIGKEIYLNEKFEHNVNRVKYREEIGQIIEEKLQIYKGKEQELVDLLNKNKIPCSLVNSVDQTLNSPQVEHMGIIKNVKNTKNYKEFKTIRNPLNFSDDDFKADIQEPPLLNQDVNYILNNILGYDQQHIQQLSKQKIIKI